MFGVGGVSGGFCLHSILEEIHVWGDHVSWSLTLHFKE